MKYSKAGYLSCLPCHILSPTLCIAHQCYHCRRRRRALFCIVIACYKIHVFELSKFLVNHEQQHFFLFWLNYVLSRLVNGKFDELNKTLEIIFVKNINYKRLTDWWVQYKILKRYWNAISINQFHQLWDFIFVCYPTSL